MVLGINTTLSIIKWCSVALLLSVIALIEYEILNSTVSDLWRQMQRYTDMNYYADGTPKFPEEHMIGWREFQKIDRQNYFKGKN